MFHCCFQFPEVSVGWRFWSVGDVNANACGHLACFVLNRERVFIDAQLGSHSTFPKRPSWQKDNFGGGCFLFYTPVFVESGLGGGESEGRRGARGIAGRRGWFYFGPWTGQGGGFLSGGSLVRLFPSTRPVTSEGGRAPESGRAHV